MSNQKTFTYAEALEQSKQYFNDNELSAKVFLDKYALRNNQEDILEPTPEEMHQRLAREFARIETEKYQGNFQENYDIFLKALQNFSRIVAQGSPMAAIGNTFQKVSASNCVVVQSPEDSMGGIFRTGEELAQLYKRRCGVGVDISTLRPEGMSVNNAAKTTSGAWSFSDFFSFITRMVGQCGRRGALIITLSVHHPDILKFITMKHDLTKVTGANVSVRLSDEFLQAVDQDTEYEVRWPIEGSDPKHKNSVRARQVWQTIVDSATKTAEPGLIFWDSMTKNLPAHCYDQFKTISTNPCSEIALSAYDSCRLISINLTGYVRQAFQEDCYFSFSDFANDVALATRMADDLIDLELELIDSIRQVSQTNEFNQYLKNLSDEAIRNMFTTTGSSEELVKLLINFRDNPNSGSERELWDKLYQACYLGRRTGLGTHGLADTLAQLTIRYDGPEGLEMVDKIYRVLRDTAYGTSVQLAKERGPFPVFDWEKEKNCEFIRRLPEDLLQNMQQYGRRNISLLTQAPTGSVSILSRVGEFNTYNVSSGVEPVFRNSYVRRKKINAGEKDKKVDFTDVMGDIWQEFTVYHSNISNYFTVHPDKTGQELPDFFVTSDQIDWQARVQLQGVEQQYIDHSISSTVNLPKGTSSEVVGQLYLQAWKQGLKGVTVYVDGSRDGVLITKDDSKKTPIDGRPAEITSVMAPKRPKELNCEIHHATLKGVKWTVLVGLLQGRPYELFMGRSTDLVVPQKHKLGKLIKAGKGNYNLQVDGDDEILVKNIIKTSDDNEAAWATRMISMSLRHGIPVEYLVDQLSKDGSVVDINNVLARILRKYLRTTQEKCPKCEAGQLIYEEKCKRCLWCGWVACS